ncbi:MAG: inositol monophosphatase family protein, partial [Hyphomicrobium sp.]
TGSAALDLAWTAAGRFDAYWERNLKPWDIAAGVVLVREAGGVITDIDGSDGFLDSGNIVAGNKAIHRTLSALVTGVPAAPQRERLTIGRTAPKDGTEGG